MNPYKEHNKTILVMLGLAKRLEQPLRNMFEIIALVLKSIPVDIPHGYVIKDEDADFIFDALMDRWDIYYKIYEFEMLCPSYANPCPKCRGPGDFCKGHCLCKRDCFCGRFD